MITVTAKFVDTAYYFMVAPDLREEEEEKIIPRSYRSVGKHRLIFPEV
jgi:hypothetical protein